MPKQFTEKDAITNVQRYLRYLSLYEEGIPEIAVDGIFGDETEEALRAFQRQNGLAETGYADKETFDSLYNAYNESIKRTALPDPIILFPSYPLGYELVLGDTGFLVSAVQHILIELSTVFDGFDNVPLSGIYDTETENAVKLFQALSGLDITGKVNKQTWNEMVRLYNIFNHYAPNV